MVQERLKGEKLETEQKNFLKIFDVKETKEEMKTNKTFCVCYFFLMGKIRWIFLDLWAFESSVFLKRKFV